jgi:hypothetical protein
MLFILILGISNQFNGLTANRGICLSKMLDSRVTIDLSASFGSVFDQ